VSSFGLAVSADAQDLVELIRSAYRGQSSRQGWTSEADLVGGDRIDVQQVLEMIEASNSIVPVLRDEGRIIACCHLERRGKGLAHFGAFAVSPPAQGIGLGRRLMGEAERLAVLTFGSKVLELTALAQQEKLIAWYERIGFSRTGETRPFPADPRHARPLRNDLYFVVLSKRLINSPARTTSSAAPAPQ
jgi:ribosomal protein S18 acetylase RimI-like enzyme